MSEDKIDITCYLKPHCGWSKGVRAIMKKYGLEYENKDIIANPAFRWEMEQKSGQKLSPCVLINGTMLADVSGLEVETWMLEKNLIEPNDTEPEDRIDGCCHTHPPKEEHAAAQ